MRAHSLEYMKFLIHMNTYSSHFYDIIIVSNFRLNFNIASYDHVFGILCQYFRVTEFFAKFWKNILKNLMHTVSQGETTSNLRIKTGDLRGRTALRKIFW